MSSNVLAAVLEHVKFLWKLCFQLLSMPHRLGFTHIQSQAPLIPVQFPTPNTLPFSFASSAIFFNSVISFWSFKIICSLIYDRKHSITKSPMLFHFSIRIKTFGLAHSVNAHFWVCVCTLPLFILPVDAISFLSKNKLLTYMNE